MLQLKQTISSIDKIRQVILLTNHEKTWYNKFIQSGCTGWKFFYFFQPTNIVEKAVFWSWSSQETAAFFDCIAIKRPSHRIMRGAFLCHENTTWRFPVKYAIIRIIPITERLWNRCIRLHILKTHFKQNLASQDKAVWFLRFRLRLSLNRNTATQMPFGDWMLILTCGWFGSSPMQSEKRGHQRFDRLGWAEIREWAFLQLVRHFAPIPSGFLW